jgi:hypothetical protein
VGLGCRAYNQSWYDAARGTERQAEKQREKSPGLLWYPVLLMAVSSGGPCLCWASASNCSSSGAVASRVCVLGEAGRGCGRRLSCCCTTVTVVTVCQCIDDAVWLACQLSMAVTGLCCQAILVSLAAPCAAGGGWHSMAPMLSPLGGLLHAASACTDQ